MAVDIMNEFFHLLVKGKLMDMLERKPSGGYRTNGSDSEGVMTRAVPGGRARRPSLVTHKIRFCLECALLSEHLEGTNVAARRDRQAASARMFMAPVS